ALARERVGGREPHHARSDDGDSIRLPLAEKPHHPGFLPTRFRSTPIPSTSSSTTSPGWSQRPSPCSRMQPVPTVPEPITSPGTSWVLAEARSRIASHEWYMSPRL